MRTRLLTAVLALFALFALTRTAPAGPGDSDPVGPDPYCLIHAPNPLSHNATTVTIWVHSHNMSSGQTATLSVNKSGFTLTNHSTYDMGGGSWDDSFSYNIAAGTLRAGKTLLWTANVTDLSDNTVYSSGFSESVN